MSNSLDPDEIAQNEQCRLVQHCLQKPTIIVYGSEIVKTGNTPF